MILLVINFNDFLYIYFQYLIFFQIVIYRAMPMHGAFYTTIIVFIIVAFGILSLS